MYGVLCIGGHPHNAHERCCWEYNIGTRVCFHDGFPRTIISLSDWRENRNIMVVAGIVGTSANRWGAHSIVMLLEFDTFF